MFADLIATDGVEERCEIRSRVGLMALHGGLEAGTAEIAEEVARRSGASLYAVVQPDDFRWHVPSRHYLPEESERLASFCGHVDHAISLHGYGGVRGSERRWTTILVGGGSTGVAELVASEVRTRLPDYEILDTPTDIPPQYRGVHPDNPVNRVRRGGAQVELPPRVRGTSPIWADHDFSADPWVPHTRGLIDALVAAVARLEQS